MSTPNARILNSIYLKIYAAEKVAIIDPENYGRENLFKLITLSKSRDIKASGSSLFQLLGYNVDLTDANTIRKDMLYLRQDPPMFKGTVRENIDPHHRFSDTEIVRTLHFLKVFEALQHFTGFDKAKEIAISLRQKEGKVKVQEVETGEGLDSEEEATLSNIQGETPRFDLDKLLPPDLLRYKTQTSPTSKRKSFRSQRSAPMSPFKKTIQITSEMDQSKQFDKIDSFDEETPRQVEGLMSPRITPLNTLVRDEQSFKNNRQMEKEKDKQINSFFKNQLENEMPIPERAKRIDKRLQQFDDNYQLHRVQFQDESEIIRLFLRVNVGKNGKRMNSALKKICQLAKAFLQKPRLIMLDEDALRVPLFDLTFYVEKLFDALRESAIFALSKNYRNLHYYSRVYVMSKGTIKEQGNPLELVDNNKSFLHRILALDDIRTVRQLENKIKKNQTKFLEFLDKKLFNVDAIEESLSKSRNSISHSLNTNEYKDSLISGVNSLVDSKSILNNELRCDYKGHRTPTICSENLSSSITSSQDSKDSQSSGEKDSDSAHESDIQNRMVPQNGKLIPWEAAGGFNLRRQKRNQSTNSFKSPSSNHLVIKAAAPRLSTIIPNSVYSRANKGLNIRRDEFGLNSDQCERERALEEDLSPENMRVIAKNGSFLHRRQNSEALTNMVASSGKKRGTLEINMDMINVEDRTTKFVPHEEFKLVVNHNNGGEELGELKSGKIKRGLSLHKESTQLNTSMKNEEGIQLPLNQGGIFSVPISKASSGGKFRFEDEFNLGSGQK